MGGVVRPVSRPPALPVAGHLALRTRGLGAWLFPERERQPAQLLGGQVEGIWGKEAGRGLILTRDHPSLGITQTLPGPELEHAV